MIVQQLQKSVHMMNRTACAQIYTVVSNRSICCMSKGLSSISVPSYREENVRERYNHHQQNSRIPHDKRLVSRSNQLKSMSTATIDHDFPLKSYNSLLKGLEVNTVQAEDDGHPLAVYTIANNDATEEVKPRSPVLLLHGRTWSSVPVYHLVGGHQNKQAEESADSRSLIEALYNTESIQPYAMDFRGFGGTPKDESGFVEPLRCVKDVISVLNWIQSNHVGGETKSTRPALLGWSHGALIAQIAAQRHPESMSKLILYGSIYNPNVKYSIPPPQFSGDNYKGQTDHDDFPVHEMASQNEFGNATEDFTHNHVVSNWFAEAALICDPIKVQWWNLHQLNECHPSLVKVPTMVIAGDQDPYAPMLTQAELFTHLGKGEDRVWSIIANADHAAHLSDRRDKLVENVRNFLDDHN